VVENPLKALLSDWLPEIDFGVLGHGFAPHGRDYVLILQAAATYEVTLTHVVEVHYETRVADDVWPRSWDDVLTDYAAWEAAGTPDGYVWGSNWSLAYPGLDAPDNNPVAEAWTARLGRQMYAASVETDRFKLTIIFHSARARKLSDDCSVVGSVLNPLPPVN
jgi:hypothetical protein